jgi:hypothetical protein
MRIISVTEVPGPASLNGEQYFVVIRRAGLIRGLLGHRQWAIVRWNGCLEQPDMWWGDSGDAVVYEVRSAVIRYVTRRAVREHNALLRGDRHWQNCEINTNTCVLQSGRGES